MDLGLGAITQQDLADQEEERKKKLLQAQSSGLNAMGPATQALYTPAAGSVLS